MGADEVRGEFTVKSESHLHGRLIVQQAFPEVHDSLMRVIGNLPIPLRPLVPFTKEGRTEPKRQKMPGTMQYRMMPVCQKTMNSRLKQSFKEEGWMAEPSADPKFIDGTSASNLKGDFVRGKVFVEVEFGNSSSMFRDLFKFQVASRSRVGEVAVLVVATDRFARRFDSNVATFESALKLLPYMAIGLQMPVWILGIEPHDFSAIKLHYEKMRQVCEAHGVSCCSFEESDVALEGSANEEEPEE